MPRFVDGSLQSFLDALASPDPTPGGGTAAAIAGAAGAALLMMVAGLKKTRTGEEAEGVALQEARAGLAAIRERLIGLADRDSDAFSEVLAVYRTPKSTDEEKRARALQQALRGATEAPLETLRAAVEATSIARVVGRHGNPSAASDVRVALELLEAAGAGGAANVESNLSGLDDERYREAAAGEVMQLTNRLTEAAAAARAALAPPAS